MGEWSFLSSLLDKVQSHSTVFGKVWMSILFLFRIFILAAGVDKIWGDEHSNIDCNAKNLGCKNSCYDKYFPLSHTRFWVLQILTVSTPTLIYLGHVLLVIRRENKMRRRVQEKLTKNGMKKIPKYSNDNGKVQLKGILLFSYLVQLVVKIILEVSFIVGQYFLYGYIFMPAKIVCSTFSCSVVDCFITRRTEKSIFIIFMLAMGVLSVVLNILEIFHLIFSKLRARKKRRSSVPEELSSLNKPVYSPRETVTFC